MIHIASNKTKSQLSAFQPTDVQPNAIDVRLSKVFAISKKAFVISEEFKQHRGTAELLPDTKGFWTLQPGTYEVVMDGTVKMGDSEAGWIISRSTFNRNGLFLTSGLYDSGYEGVMAAALHVTSGPAVIAVGTRIGQFLLFKAEAVSSYNGSYGTASDHDKKYTQ
jgi:deoxycytidine triphosphate deaminase